MTTWNLIRRRMEELQEAAYKLCEAAYQQASAQSDGNAGGPHQGGGESAEDEVVQEAEYEVINDEK